MRCRPRPSRACRSDADCVKTQLDCCGCTAGGVAVAVNKQAQSRFDRRRERSCGESVVCVAAISSSWTCTGTPICAAGTCRIAWAVGGACTRDDDWSERRQRRAVQAAQPKLRGRRAACPALAQLFRRRRSPASAELESRC